MINYLKKIISWILGLFIKYEKLLKIQDKLAEGNHYYLKLAVDNIGRDALRSVLHNNLYCNFTKHKGNLYTHLKNNYHTALLDKLKKGKINQIQFDTMFNGITPNETDSKTFDLTLLFLLLSEMCSLTCGGTCTGMCGLKAPTNGWYDPPNLGDISTEANVIRINLLRNKLNKEPLSYFFEQNVNTLWSELRCCCLAVLQCDPTIVDVYRPRLYLLRRIKLNIVMSLYYATGLVFIPIVFTFLLKRFLNIIKKEMVIIKQRKDNIAMFLKRGITDNFVNTIKGKMSKSKLGLVLTGLGGVGKTELAKAIYNELRSDYKNVIWIEADKLKEEFKNLYDILHMQPIKMEDISLKVIAYKVYKKLQSSTLIVIDNVNQPSEIKDILPDESFITSPFLIITSQYQQWDESKYIIREIGVFDKYEAEIFVKTNWKKSKQNEKEISELVVKLGLLPLALTQVVSYLNENKDCTIPTYLKQFREYNTGLDKEIEGYERTLHTIWNLAKEKFRLKLDVILLYQLMSFLDGKGINKNILLGIGATGDLFKGNIPLKTLKREDKLNYALAELQKYSLINTAYNTEETEKIISIHELMQTVVRSDLIKELGKVGSIQIGHIDFELLNILIQSEDSITTEKDKKQYRYGTGWIYHLINIIRKCDTDEFRDAINHFINLSKEDSLKESLLSKGNYNECYDVFSILSKATKPGMPNKNELLFIVAYCLLKRGKYKDAKVKFEELLQKMKNDRKENEEDRRVEIQYFIGHCLMKSESYNNAITTLEQVLNVQKQEYLETSQQYLLTRHDIAYSKFKLARYEEAKKEYEEILPIQERNCGHLHKDTLLTSHSLGHCLIELGKYEEARVRLKTTLERKIEAFGKLHHETLITHHTLGLVLMHLKEYDEASEIFRVVYINKKTALGVENPSTLVTHHRIGNCKKEQGQFKEALKVFEEVYELRKTVLGDEKERTLLTRNDIAFCYMQLREYKKALTIFEEIYQIQERLFSNKKVSTFTTKFNIALCYKDRDHHDKKGDYNISKTLLEEVLKLQISHYGEYHETVVSTRQYLHESEKLIDLEEKKYK